MMVKKIKNSKGASVVEFALVVLIFFIFIFGIIDFGWYFFCQHSIELATREGARIGVVRGDDTSIKERIRDRASIAVDPNNLNISILASTSDPDTRHIVTQYTHQFFSPLIGILFSDGSTIIQTEATYRIEPKPYVPPGG